MRKESLALRLVTQFQAGLYACANVDYYTMISIGVLSYCLQPAQDNFAIGPTIDQSSPREASICRQRHERPRPHPTTTTAQRPCTPQSETLKAWKNKLPRTAPDIQH